MRAGSWREMLSRCLSSLILRLVVLVARWLKRPLHHYVSFNRRVPFLRVGLTGRWGGREGGKGQQRSLLHEAVTSSFAGFGLRFEQLRLVQKGWVSE